MRISSNLANSLGKFPAPQWCTTCFYALAMDISRPDLRKKRIRRNIFMYLGIAVAVGIGVFFIWRLKPAIATVDSAVWTDTVKRGPLLIQVRGPGELVPREDGIRLIPAETEATVIRIRVLPGTHVEPDMILMDLVDPE
jgi:HlyD family secretion protein